MDIRPESYSSLPSWWRIFSLVAGVFLAFCFLASPAPLKLWAILFLCCIVLCITALLLSKVRVESDRLAMTFAPLTTTVFWNEVRSLRFGVSIAPPVVPTIFIVKANGRKVVFPIHGMSIHNKQVLAEAFAGEKMVSNNNLNPTNQGAP